MVQRMQFPKVPLNCRESKFSVHNSNVGIGEVIKVSSLHAEKIRFRNANKLLKKALAIICPLV